MISPAFPQDWLKILLDHHTFAVIGHRGAAGLEPENTMASFKRAVQIGCPVIELDVHRCKHTDAAQSLRVVHDADVERTTNGRGRIASMTQDQVDALKCTNGERIPKLAEVLDWLSVEAPNVALNIELKGQHTASAVFELVQLPKYAKLKLIVSSFDHNQLLEYRGLDQSIPIALLYHKWEPEWFSMAREVRAASINLDNRITTNVRVREIKAKGFEVFVYTVNGLRSATKLRDWGVAGVLATDLTD